MIQVNRLSYSSIIPIFLLISLNACDDDQESREPLDMSISLDINPFDMAGEVMAGEVMAGETMAGEIIAGETMAGEIIAGETMAGEVMAGETMGNDDSQPYWKHLSLGWEHGCGLSSHGEVTCWGRNQQGQAEPNMIDWLNVEPESISIGRYHTCIDVSPRNQSAPENMLQSNIVCWGRNAEGQLNIPTDLSLSKVSAGWRETCALDEEGHPHCWGELNPERLPSADLTLSNLKLSQGFGCGLDANNASIHCWGRNEYQQAIPPSGTEYQSLSVGTGQHSCAISSEKLARCWGDSSDGKTLAPAVELKDLSVGKNHTCGLTLDNTVICWGRNHHGQCNAPAGQFQWVSSGPTFSCGLRVEDTLTCWGSFQAPPTPLFSQVSVGLAHTCALKVDQTLSCWGWPRAGRSEPPAGTFTQVTVGNEHSCAVSTDSEIMCWGVGIDPTRFERDGDYDQATPPPLGGVQTVSAGAYHTCALQVDGQVHCWGSDQYGQVTVPPLEWPAVQITTGRNHSCARSETGLVVCWGDHQVDQLSIPEDELFTHIEAGGNTTCGQKEDQTLSCWGDEYNTPLDAVRAFSLGEQTLCIQPTISEEMNEVNTFCDTATSQSTSYEETPWRFTLSAAELNSIEAGSGHACALRVDQRVTCFGTHSPTIRPKLFE